MNCYYCVNPKSMAMRQNLCINTLASFFVDEVYLIKLKMEGSKKVSQIKNGDRQTNTHSLSLSLSLSLFLVRDREREREREELASFYLI